MHAQPRLPDWLQRELDNPASPGQRHVQIKSLARGLIWCGLAPGDCFAMIRSRYNPDVPDREIESLIRWSVHNVTPRGQGYPSTARRAWTLPESTPSAPTLPPVVAVRQFVGNVRFDEADLFHASPVHLSGNFEDDARLFLETVFDPLDQINLVWDFAVEGEKARPVGKGLTLSRRDWIEKIHRDGIPHGKAGAWVRINPLDGKGVSDANVVAFPFLLLECDEVPMDLQLTFLATLPIPIVAIITSGGRSAHAWLRTAAADVENYRTLARKIFSRLVPFGIDPANKNPSRLARLPGVPRGIGGVGESRQRLLYLNPNALTSQSIF